MIYEKPSVSLRKGTKTIMINKNIEKTLKAVSCDPPCQ